MSLVLLVMHWILPFLAAAGTVLIHYYAIQFVISRIMPAGGFRRALPNMVEGLLLLLAAHLLEIALFALSYMILHAFADGPVLIGNVNAGFYDAMYYSATTYTSLGLGDVSPADPARLLTGVEALTGLIMIAWTAAFLFAETERFEKD